MKLGAVIFLAYLVILALCFWYPLTQISNELRTAYLESAEEPLVDTANILAAIVGQTAENGKFSADNLYQVFDEAHGRDVAAQIYEMRKDKVDLSVYITDAKGIVVFDSESRETIGQDYSEWRDVARTLRGEYGARVRRDPDDPNGATALFVAAPIRVSGKIAGVLTVIKPTIKIAAFRAAIMPHIYKITGISLSAAIVLSLGVSIWLTQQVSRLTRYANDMRAGLRVPFPKLAATELKTMGTAFEKMREALAGQSYVKQYVETLTHEIKSPISAIRGAAELLEDPAMAPENRAHFLSNIQNETRRIQQLVDRMLKLSELEVRRELGSKSTVVLVTLARAIVEGAETALLKKRLNVEIRIADDLAVAGDPMLLHLAVSNLVQNAIDFSSEGGRVGISAAKTGGQVELYIDDEGPGIPEYAQSRLFEKFYSLERPDTGRKNTGLGLNFVKEAAALHGGTIEVNNLSGQGLRARLVLPSA